VLDAESLPEMVDDVAQAPICRLCVFEANKLGDFLQRESFLITQPNKQPVGVGQASKRR